MALDPDEDAAQAEVEAASNEAAIEPGPPIVTTVRIWRSLLFVPFLVAIVLAVVCVRLGSPLAALLVLFVALLFGMAGRRRVSRYRFDDAGTLYLDDEEEPLDWAKASEIAVAHRSPWLTPRSRRDMEVNVLDIRIALVDGTQIRFARGDHFVEGGGRRPLTPGVFERWLERRALEANLRVERVGPGGFIARR